MDPVRLQEMASILVAVRPISQIDPIGTFFFVCKDMDHTLGLPAAHHGGFFGELKKTIIRQSVETRGMIDDDLHDLKLQLGIMGTKVGGLQTLVETNAATNSAKIQSLDLKLDQVLSVIENFQRATKSAPVLGVK